MKQNDITDLPSINLSRVENIFNIYTDNNLYFYNLLNTVNFDHTNISPIMYYEYNVRQGDTYTAISYRIYNTINLWWLICSFNNIDNPINIPEPGTRLKILYQNYVNEVLNTISTNNK